MDEGFQSGSIVGDRETNDAELAYCRALSGSGITHIPASASDQPFLSFLPYAIATAPSFLPFIPFLLSSILVLGATRPATLAAKAPVPKFRRLIQIVFSIIAAGTAMLLAGLAPGGICALALNGFGQIGYPIAFFHDGALTTTTAGDVFTTILLALLAGGTLISVCSVVLSTATRRVFAGPLASALLVAAPAFPLLSDSALGHNAALGLLPLAVFSPIEATGYVGCFPTEFIGSGSSGASMLAVALAYVAVLFAVGAVAARSPKQAGPAKKHHGLELLDASVGYGSTTILSIGSLSLGPGTAAGLVAPNGSGKTTLLEALSGQFPTRIRSGSLAADGISQRRSAEFAELVYLSSSGSADLYPTLSAIEHLSFVREAWKSGTDIDSLCDSLGISPYLDKPTRKLSTGMKQQVKLAVADLGLEEGEHVTAIRFEYGRVEQGFTTRDGGWDREGIKDVHDDIASAEDTAAENGSDTDDSGTGTGTAYAPAIVRMKATDGYTAGTSLDNYARVDLTRNGGGDGLEDHDEDQVTQTAKAVTVPPTNLDQTGRNVIIGLAATLAAAAAAAAALIYRRRHAYPDPVPAGGEDDGYEEDAHEREYRDDRYPDGYDRDPYGYDDGYRDSYRDRY